MFIDPTTSSQVHADTPNIGIARGFCSPGFAAEPGAARAGRLRLPPLGQPAAMPLRAQEGQPRASQAVRMDNAAGAAGLARNTSMSDFSASSCNDLLSPASTAFAASWQPDGPARASPAFAFNASADPAYDMGCNRGYDSRYEPSYDSGYTSGYEPGYTAGHEHGYTASHEHGYTSSYEHGYTASHDPGYFAADPGYSAEYEPGYHASYEHGVDPGGGPNYDPGYKPGYNPAQYTGSDPGHATDYRIGVSSGHDPGYDARSDFALPHPSISRPAMGPAELTSTALVVYERVRRHYRGKAKSGNKLRVSSDPANQRARADYERWRRAAALLAPLHAARAPMQDLMEAGVGNCDDMASHAALLAREAGLKATLWGMWDAQGNAGYHCFCVVSAPGETGSPFEGGAVRHGVNLVLDPWSGVIDRVENYGPRMAAKMHKWAREGKQIHCANLGGWIAATDPRWLDVVAVPRPFPIPF